MTTTTLIIVVAVLVVAAVALYAMRRRAQLKARFGPEYERVVHETGSAFKAEAKLTERASRVQKYEIRRLSPDEAQRFDDEWRRAQALFVDDPGLAVTRADALVTEVMTARGYPMTDFDRRAEDLTVDHAAVVQHYRAARDIAIRHAERRATTEDLRQAFVHYRALFDDLLQLKQVDRVGRVDA
jgi:hypothetical protein